MIFVCKFAVTESLGCSTKCLLSPDRWVFTLCCYHSTCFSVVLNPAEKTLCLLRLSYAAMHPHHFHLAQDFSRLASFSPANPVYTYIKINSCKKRIVSLQCKTLFFHGIFARVCQDLIIYLHSYSLVSLHFGLLFFSISALYFCLVRASSETLFGQERESFWQIRLEGL